MKRIYRFCIRNIFILISFLIGLVYTISNISPTLYSDEPFTLGIVQHSFLRIIYLDSMDVHPPLYYLCLKLFLIIPQLLTNSMLIQVILAKIFSIIIFICIIYALIKLTKIIHIQLNTKMQIALVLLIPTFMARIINIRMYNLSVLFLLIELYTIVKFISSKDYEYLIVATILVTLNLYTFYIAAVSAEFYLCIPSILSFIKHKYILCIKLLIPNIISVILFLPWIPILLKQYIYHINADNHIPNNMFDILTGSLTQEGGLRKCLFLIFDIIFTIYAVYFMNNTYIKLILCSTLLNILFTIGITLLICHKDFQDNTIYPISIVYMLIIITIIGYILSNHIDNKFICMALCFTIILFGFSLRDLHRSVRQYSSRYVPVLTSIRHWKHNPNKNISVHANNIANVEPSGKQFNATQNSLYLYGLNKNAFITNLSYKNLSKGVFNNNHGKRLLRQTFPNLYVK